MKVIQVIKDLWNTVRHRDETSKFASDVFIHGVSQIFAQARGVILLPLISIGLSISDYGIWTQTSATANLLLPLLILGLDQAAVRYLPGMQDDKKRFAEAFFSMLMVIGLTCILVLFIVWPARSRLSQLILGDDGYVTYIYLLFMLVIGQISFRYLLNYWRLIGKIAHYAVIRMVMDAALLLGIAVIIAGLKFSILVGIIYWVCLQWLFSFCLLLAILRQIPFLFTKNLNLVRPYLRYALPLVLYAGVYWVINSSDRYFIVHYFSLVQVGIYSAAYTLSGLATSVKIPLNFVLLPTLSKMWSNDEEDRVRYYTEHSMNFYWIVAVPLVVFLGAGAPVFLDLLAGVYIPEGRLVISLVGIAFLFTGMDQFFRNILMLQERTGTLFLVLVPLSILNLILNFLLIPRFGILGAAIATMVSMFLKAIALYLQSVREFKYQLDFNLMGRVVLASFSFVMIVWLFPANTIIQLVLDTLFGGILYIICLMILRVFTYQDIYAYVQRPRT